MAFLISKTTDVVLSCSVVSNSFVTPWTVARQAPLSMGFSRQEHWSVLPFPSPLQGTANNSPQAKSGMITHLHIVCSLFWVIIVEAQ